MTYKDDYILRFACGRRNTAILTKLGECWIMGNFKYDMNKITNKEVKATKNEGSEDEEETKFKKEVMKGGKGKKNQGHSHKKKKLSTAEE